MTKQYRKSKTRGLRNLRSTANDILDSTGNTTMKGAEKTIKWLATDHTGATLHSNLMELEQRVNFYTSGLKLLNRRNERLSKRLARLSATGEDASKTGLMLGWIVDHLLYVFDLLWGFIWPIISMLLWTLIQTLLIILLSFILIYALYRLFTS